MRMGYRKYLISMTFLSCLSSCSSYVDERTYMSYLKEEENGLHQKQSDQLWEYELQLKTPQSMALQESMQSGKLDKERYQSLLPQFGDMIYFVLSIRPKKINDTISAFITSNTTKLSFDMQKEFSLRMDNDTLPCSLYQFENTFPISGKSSMTLAFDTKNPIASETSLTFLFASSLFSQKLIAFEFSGKDINDIPLIK